MNSKVYKWCAVPQCPNTSKKNPNKLFVYVPHDKTMRFKWLNLARRDPERIKLNSPIYFCEDHFDLPNDMDNYMEYHIMGTVAQVRMKPGCKPSKFQCQSDRKKRSSNTTERYYIAKKRRRILIEKNVTRKHLENGESSGGSSGVQGGIKDFVQEEKKTSDKSIQLCRACLSPDCQPYPLTTHRMMHETYEKLTGLMLENDDALPPSLCAGCAQQLLACARFRTRSLRAHQVLMETVNKQGGATVESIQPLNGIQFPISITSRIVDSEFETIIPKKETLYFEDVPAGSGHSISVECIKKEIDDIEEVDIFNEGLIGADVCSPNWRADSAVQVKEELEEMIEITSQPYGSESTHDDTTQLVRLKVENDVLDDNLPLTAIRHHVYLRTAEPGQETATNHNQNNDNGSSEDVREDLTSLLTCDMCSYTTRTDVELLNHLKTHLECNYITYAKHLIARHSQKHTGSETLCDICGESFADNGKLKRHLLVHSNGQTCVCMVCKKMFTTRKQLNSHVKRSLLCKKVYICDICQKEFKIKGRIIAHLERHVGIKRFKCKFCSKGFYQKHGLTCHVRTHTGERLLECDICNNLFINKPSLIKHLQTHRARDVYHECVKCDKKYLNVQTLKAHFKTHDEVGIEKYMCNLCDKSYKTKTNLNRHRAIHTGENRLKYTCDVCKKSFVAKANLKEHLRVHSGENPFACGICSQRLSSKANLVRHLPIHKIDFVVGPGVETFMCDICKRAFNEKSKFLDHKRMNHSEKRPYECETCGKSFTGKINLSHHVMVHSLEKPHTCEVCNKSFSRTNYLTVHMRRVHSDVKLE